jgi:hypothetical protein
VGTEHPNLLRLEFGLKSFNCRLQETGWNELHNVETNTMDIDLKARSSLEIGDREVGLLSTACDVGLSGGPEVCFG